jgi:hypothetical protein
LAEALLLQKQNEDLCRELGNQRELAKSLILQAAIVGLHRRQFRDAIPMAEEAYRLAVEIEDSTFINQIKRIWREIGSGL